MLTVLAGILFVLFLLAVGYCLLSGAIAIFFKIILFVFTVTAIYLTVSAIKKINKDNKPRSP